MFQEECDAAHCFQWKLSPVLERDRDNEICETERSITSELPHQP